MTLKFFFSCGMREKKETLHFRAGPLYFFASVFKRTPFLFVRRTNRETPYLKESFCSKIEVRKKETFFGRGMFWNGGTSASLRLGLEIFELPRVGQCSKKEASLCFGNQY